MPHSNRSKSADLTTNVIELGKVFASNRDSILRYAPVMRDTFARRKLRDSSLTFVRFCRDLDPTIPEVAEKYRNHPTYRVMAYMRLLTTDPTHRYIAAAWDADECNVCGEQKDEHRYGDVVPERIR